MHLYAIHVCENEFYLKTAGGEDNLNWYPGPDISSGAETANQLAAAANQTVARAASSTASEFVFVYMHLIFMGV